MKYTKYFSAITKEHGTPNLSKEQFQRMMNIVCLEGKIEGMKVIKSKYKDTGEFYKYDILIFKHEKQLADISGNLSPEDLLSEMYRLER